MNNLIVNTISFVKSIRIKPLIIAIVASWFLFANNIALASNSQDAKERINDRLEEMDKNTERPKTVGEFRQEAEQDIPLGERINNIVRDSGEAFKQFGAQYSIGAQENAREFGDNVKETGKDAKRTIERAVD
ncbi:hypothetical protein HC931_06540 [Candidatus Gracilibacteria bacterium]|nr:hypothetical protein [Candidatus Gracilibacteria bacterium]NJM87685.1 hypothetical protein [Hydrococcus sp. RU_2_2]NJP19383.1 hypothetical protein [Hydrococcus sp. CRU_1_1]NJQ96763.1 hypothetical protein [Hydrococcus sp. CSU_1_8]